MHSQGSATPKAATPKAARETPRAASPRRIQMDSAAAEESRGGRQRGASVQPAERETAQSSGVRVVCRLRPMNEREKKGGTVPVASASTERKEVSVVKMSAGGTRQVRSSFHFDDVLTSFSTQEEVFKSTLEPLVSEVLAGYEATAFAYGQTGTGKTYTMEGSLDSEEGRGLVPRAASAMIGALTSGEYAEYSIMVSYLEIYNEELSDLLAPIGQAAQRLDLKDIGQGRGPGARGGVCCLGLSEVPVSSLADILELVRRAQERRRVAETRMNARSSRSHSIFTMKVRCRKAVAAGELENMGKLHLVDLAGSECAKKAAAMFPDEKDAYTNPPVRGAKDAYPNPPVRGAQTSGISEEDRERRSINQSLLTLGRVISSLREGSGRVPYRDSKLTRLLQDALGGRCKTVIIATVSPALSAVEETISTLTYAEQASGIKNRPVASSMLRTIRLGGGEGSGAAPGAHAGSGAGSSDWAELELKVAYLSQEVEEAQVALARKYREAQEAIERASAAEERLEEVQAEAQQVREDMERELENARGARRQAREACAASQADGERLSRSMKAGAEAAVEAAREAYSAHQAASGLAAEVTKEQQDLVGELAASVRDGGAELERTLTIASAEAMAAIEADAADAVDSLSRVETAFAATGAAARERAEVAKAVLAAGEASQSEKLGGLEAAITSGRGSLQWRCDASRRHLDDARAALSAAHEAASRRLQGTIARPLAELQGLLEGTSSATDDLRQRLSADAASLVEAGASAQGRRSRLLEGLGRAAEAQAASAVSGPPPLRRALEGLRAALEANCEAADASLTSASEGLAGARATLEEEAERGRFGVAAGVDEADGHLAASWAEQRGLLGELAALLEQAAAERRDSDASEALGRAVAEASAALAASLGGAVASLASAREDVAAEVAELRRQRASEKDILALLAGQREALEADVFSMQEKLASADAELERSLSLANSLREDQELRRKSALEAIMAAVSSELQGLGEGLQAGLEPVRGGLGKASGLAREVSQAASEAALAGARAGIEVGKAASAWSEATGARCDAIGAAQERAGEAAGDVQSASARGEAALKEIGATSAAWGGASARLGGLLEDASGRRGGILADLEALQPRWQAARDGVRRASDGWGAGVAGGCEAMADAGGDVEAAKSHLAKLGAEVVAQVGAGAASAEVWERDGARHAEALGALTELGASSKEEDKAAEEARAAGLEALCREASELRGRASRACAEAGDLCAAVAAQAAAGDEDQARVDEALGAAGAASAEVASGTDADLAGLAAAAAELLASGAKVSDASREAVDAVACATAEAAEVGTAAARKHLEATSAAAECAQGRWQAADVGRRASLQVLCDAAEAAKGASAKAVDAAGEKMLAQLERAEGAKESAIAAADGIAATASAAAADGHAALRGGLAAPPLNAFCEEEYVLKENESALILPQADKVDKLLAPGATNRGGGGQQRVALGQLNQIA